MKHDDKLEVSEVIVPGEGEDYRRGYRDAVNSQAEFEADEAKERRETIATAALRGLLSNPKAWPQDNAATLARYALRGADSLIAEIDKDIK